MVYKIDSNSTGLAFAEETSLKTLPGTPVWYPLEPNSYNDFGGQIATVARNPINASRQRKKGVTTDLDASGGFSQDLTFSNTTRLLQGFFFASIREKKTTAGMNATATAITSVTSGTKTYAAAADMGGFLANHLVKAEGFTNSGNNGLKTVASASTTTELVVLEACTTESTPPAAAKLYVCGYQFASATVDITLNSNLTRITRVGGAVDFTTLGLIPGEWIYLGGDSSSVRFANNAGFGRVKGVAATYIELDKTTWTGAGEVGTAKTIQIFFGSVLKNESDPALIVRRTYNVERTLGNDGVGTQSEYLVGAVPNELTLNIAQADKVTIDLSFVAVDNEQRTGTTGVKSGTRETLTAESAFNTSSDVSQIKLALVSATDSSVDPLFAFATEASLTINNNVTPNKAIGVLGAFDTSAGTFEVGGNMTAYFADTPSVSAVRNNSDVTMNVILLKAGYGMIWDIPLLSLGDGRLSVEQDQAITLPLETTAAQSTFNHTLLLQTFAYLPTYAGGV